MVSAMTVVLVIISSILGASGMFFFKLGSSRVSFKIRDWAKNWRIILGVFLYFLAFVFLVLALKVGALSVVYPMFALSYFWVLILSQTLLKEKVRLINWAGVFLIVGGIALTTVK